MDHLAFHCGPVRGRSHASKDMPCEDAAGSKNTDRYAVVAVADGHGAEKCCRANKGAKFAVQAALDSAVEVLEGLNEVYGQVGEYRKRFADSVDDEYGWLQTMIVSKWNDLVQADFEANPFDVEKEYKIPPDKYADLYSRGENVEQMYGATCLLAIATDYFSFFLQLGDGTCWIAHPAEEDSFFLFKEDEADYGTDVTESICQAGASKRMKTYLESRYSPLAIFINSDGIDNCYGTYRKQRSFYRAILRAIQEDGAEKVSDELGPELEDLSAQGSQDDISLGCIVNTEALNKVVFYESNPELQSVASTEGEDNGTDESEEDELSGIVEEMKSFEVSTLEDDNTGMRIPYPDAAEGESRGKKFLSRFRNRRQNR